jgi:hypothetical protein
MFMRRIGGSFLSMYHFGRSTLGWKTLSEMINDAAGGQYPRKAKYAYPTRRSAILA